VLEHIRHAFVAAVMLCWPDDASQMSLQRRFLPSNAVISAAVCMVHAESESNSCVVLRGALCNVATY
jgi:hypothetical protein